MSCNDVIFWIAVLAMVDETMDSSKRIYCISELCVWSHMLTELHPLHWYIILLNWQYWCDCWFSNWLNCISLLRSWSLFLKTFLHKWKTVWIESWLGSSSSMHHGMVQKRFDWVWTTKVAAINVENVTEMILCMVSFTNWGFLSKMMDCSFGSTLMNNEQTIALSNIMEKI